MRPTTSQPARRTARTLATLTLLLGLGSAAPALAVEEVTDCSFTCTTDCVLNYDIICFSSQGIALTAGADLDLQGHSIICADTTTSDGDCATTAVTITDPDSVIRDTGTTPGKILGGFFKGVDCLSKSGSRVTGIWIEGLDGAGIINCAQVDRNVIIAKDDLEYPLLYAIQTIGVAASGDFTRDNYISGFTSAIKVTGSKAVSVDHNLIILGDAFVSGTAIAVNMATSPALTVAHNTIMGDHPVPLVLGNGVSVFTGNRCDAANPNCPGCIASGWCDDPQIPLCIDDTVRLRPVANGPINQADRQKPSTPAIPKLHRWLLVNDYPDMHDGVNFTSAVENYNAVPTVRTDLFWMAPEEYQESGLELSNCTIRAHMVPQGTPAAVNLVVKVGGTQSDGAVLTVTGPAIQEYSRVMDLNPVTGVAWTTDDLNGGILIGVKNNLGAGSGVIFGDLILDCH